MCMGILQQNCIFEPAFMLKEERLLRMYCVKCGERLPDNVNYCTHCGSKTGNDHIDPRVPVHTPPSVQQTCNRPCPKCQSRFVQFQTVTESRKTGCFKILLYILLAVTFVGWLILIPLLLRKKTNTVTYGVCQSCGNRWRI